MGFPVSSQSVFGSLSLDVESRFSRSLELRSSIFRLVELGDGAMIYSTLEIFVR